MSNTQNMTKYMIIATVLKFFPFHLNKYRYSFYQIVKNSGLTLKGRIRHSNLKLPLNLGDWIQYWIFMNGAYERNIVDFLRPHVQGRIFFDVGANIGNYTLTLAKDAKQIFSFEASPSNAKILANFINISELKNVELINKAVAVTSGETISLYISPDTTGNHTQYYDFGKGSEYNKTISLDDFIYERQLPRVDVIKIDIEGAEFDAIRGAENILTKFHPLLVVEFNSETARQANWRLHDLYSYILSFGYKAYEIKNKRLTAFDPSILQQPNIGPNIIFSSVQL